LVHDFGAVISHDGHRLAFVRETSNTSGDLFIADVDGSHIRQVTFDRMGVRGVAWTPDDRALVFASNRSGAYELWQVPASGGAAQSIAAKGSEVTSPSLARDGGLLAYTSTSQNWNIWRAPVAAADANATPPKVLIASFGRNDSPRYSPDGKKIAFISDRSGSWELWVSDSDGHDLRQITSFGGPVVGTPHWSPDGRYLVFDARPNGRSVIFTVASTGGNPQPVVQEDFENKKPNWSRDGRSIYYTSSRGGKAQLWRSGVHGEHPIRLTTDTCNDSAESADGKYIYFQNDQNGIYRLPIGGGAAELVPELAGVYPSRYFDVLEDIYFLDQENVPRLIRQYDPESHKLSTVGRIDRQLVYGTPSLSISPDHRFILFAQQDNSSSEIMALRK
jgi:Tol biopolymer transport system component